MSFLNPALLFGLAALAVPVLIHFFSRKQFEEVDWAAMRFLQVDHATRRRKNFDHLLLMALRCGAIAAFVLALAAPTIPHLSVPRILGGEPRDVIILIDNSASMAGAPADAAKSWAGRFLNTVGSSDRVAIDAVRRGLIPIVPTWSNDPDRARLQLNVLPAPASSADWPSAFAVACSLFDDTTRDRHLIIVTDGQKYGMADEGSLARWPLSVPNRGNAPRMWIVPVATDRTTDSSAPVLNAITASRGIAVANREIAFHSTVRTISGTAPAKVNVEWDGRTAGDANVAADGTIALTRRFPAGSHVLTIQAGISRQDFAFTVVPSIPVLIVDGDPKADRETKLPLRIALAPAKDQTAGFAIRAVSSSSFGSVTLQQDVAGPGTPPRIIVFANVEKLTADQNRAIENYLQNGGAVLVAPGDRCNASAWNGTCLRGGQGWLPARFDRIVETASASPLPAASTHPAMIAFRETLPGGLSTARFPQYWKLDPTIGPNAIVACSLTTGDPFLVDRGFGRGRAILACVPFDRSWGTSFPAQPDFVRLMHELAFALAGTKGNERNLNEGSAIVFTPDPAEPPAGVTVQAPDQPARFVPVTQWPMVFDETNAAGVYRLTTASGRTNFFAVRGDPRENDLTPMDERDRSALIAAVPGLAFISEPSEVDSSRTVSTGVASAKEVWWIAMIAVLALFAGELWYARRLAGEWGS